MVDERPNQRLSPIPEKAPKSWHFLIVLVAVRSRTDRKDGFELAVEEIRAGLPAHLSHPHILKHSIAMAVIHGAGRDWQS
jgi:hypothetical protein